MRLRRRAAASPASAACSPTSARSCATHRSAGSGRRRPTPSNRRSAKLGVLASERRGAGRRTAQARRADHRRPAPCRSPRARRCCTPAVAPRRRDPDAVLRRHPHAEERLPRVRGRARGRRTLVPACSRKAEEGMVVHTDTERVRTSRRMVLEFLGSTRRPVARRRTSTAGTNDYERRRRPLRRRTRRTVAATGQASTTTCTCATTRSASSATSASTPAVISGRTPSPSPSAGAVSIRTSPRSSTSPCRTRPASTAATASPCAPPAR